VLARPHVAGLYASPLVDEVIPYTPPSGWRGLPARWKLAGELRKRRFDVAVLLQNAEEAAVIAMLARIPVRIGYNRASRGRWLTHPIPLPRAGEIPDHQRYSYLELLRRSGLIDALPEVAEVKLTRLSLSGAPEKQLQGIWLGIAPGSANGAAKRWLPERFAEAAAIAAKVAGAEAAIFGSAAERDLCERVAGLIRAKGIRAVNFAGETTIAEFVAMAASCAAFLTNDSGAMHVAGTLGVPTVAVFGPTDPHATGAAVKILREPVDCSPCLLHECPIDHRCMTAVSADRAAAGLVELLAVPQPEGPWRT